MNSEYPPIFTLFRRVSDFQSVLESLPGVDPQSDAVRQAVGAMSRSGTDNTKKEDSEKKDDKSKK